MENKDTEINKAIEELVDQELEKAMPTSLDENGGKDKIKSGSPFTEQGEGKAASTDESPTKGSGEKKMKKSDDDDESEDSVEKAKSEDEKESKDLEKDMYKKKMKKSQEDLGELDEDEIELIKCWREEKAQESEEEVVKSMTPSAEDFSDVISKAVSSAIEPLRKSLDEKDELIKSLKEDVEKISSQPAYDKRSITNLETIEKGGEQPAEISKSQVKDKLLELQFAGKGVTSHHIAEFEGTGNISDSSIKKLVMDSFK